MRVVGVAEMRALEARTMEAGTSERALMERAGKEVAVGVAEYLPRTGGRLLVTLVGKGNNGGDALIASQHLWAGHGMKVVLYLVAERPADPLLEWTEASGVETIVHGGRSTTRLEALLDEADVVLDGILGIGARPPLTGTIGQILDVCRRVRPAAQRRVAVDVPTGVDADTGQCDARAFRADLTLATGPAKPGVLIHPGAELAGRVRELEIGLVGWSPDCNGWRLDDRRVAKLLPHRADDSHKGTYGRVLVVGGSERYVGAPLLTGSAAIRAGAGLVTLAVPAAVKRAVAGVSPETTYLPLDDDPAAPGRLTSGHLGPLIEAARSADAVAIGPGLGVEPETRRLILLLLERLAVAGTPVVLDADGLNALATAPTEGWSRPSGVRWVLTPHPGEMGRLAAMDTEAVQRDRFAVARSKARDWGQVVVLKGAPTIIAAPDCETRLNVFANGALAVGGTGDVLTGAIAALLAQGLGPFDAATVGSYAHGLAGELWRGDRGAAGLPASALAERVPDAMKCLRALA